MAGVRRNDLASNIMRGYQFGMQIQQDQRVWEEQQRSDESRGILAENYKAAGVGPYGTEGPGFTEIQREDGAPPTAPQAATVPIQPSAAMPSGALAAPQAIPAPAQPAAMPSGAPTAPQAAAVPAAAAPAAPAQAAQNLLPASPQAANDAAAAIGANQETKQSASGKVLSRFRATKATDWEMLIKTTYAETLDKTGSVDYANKNVAYINATMKQGFAMGLQRAQQAVNANQYDRAAEELTRAWTYYPNGMGSAVFVVQEDDGSVNLYGVPMDEDGEEFDSEDKLFLIDQEAMDKYLRTATDATGEAQHRRSRSESLEDATAAAKTKGKPKALTASEKDAAYKTFDEEVTEGNALDIMKGFNLPDEDEGRKSLPELRTKAIQRYMDTIQSGGFETPSQSFAATIEAWKKAAEQAGSGG